MQKDIDYILVETILSQLFLLPKPPFKELFYAVLFIDFFKIQQSIIPVVLPLLLLFSTFPPSPLPLSRTSYLLLTSI
jgi:hypothetical protein